MYIYKIKWKNLAKNFFNLFQYKLGFVRIFISFILQICYGIYIYMAKILDS